MGRRLDARRGRRAACALRLYHASVRLKPGTTEYDTIDIAVASPVGNPTFKFPVCDP